MAYGNSGYVFLRYGAFEGDDTEDDRSAVSEKLKAVIKKGNADDLFIKGKSKVF